MSGEDLRSGEKFCCTQPKPHPHHGPPKWRNRIGPLLQTELTEIRPGRWLKILHITAGGRNYGSSVGDDRQAQSTDSPTIKGDNTVLPNERFNVEISNTDPSISKNTERDSELKIAPGKTEHKHQEGVNASLTITEESEENTDDKGTSVDDCNDAKDFERQAKDAGDELRDDVKTKDVSTPSNNLSASSQLEQHDTANSKHFVNNVDNKSGGSSHGCTTGSTRSVRPQSTNGLEKCNLPEENPPSTTKTHNNINHSNSNVNDSGTTTTTTKDKCKLETFYDKTRSRNVANRMFKGKEKIMRQSSEDDIPPSETVLFFLHGVGGSSEVWMAQVNYFAAKGYQVVAPDLLGHGQSSSPETGSAYHFREHARDMTAIFERYSGKRNVVIGHSYGCTFCTLLAHEQGLRLSRLVMISGGAPSPLEPQPCHIFCLPVCLLDCISPMLVKCFLRRAFNTQGHLSAVEDMHKSFNVPAHVLRGTMVGQVWHEGDEVYHTEIEVPTLLIHGRQDGLVPLQDEYGMEEALPHCRLEVIEDVSHMVMMECPDRVNQLIHDFILQDSEEFFSQKHVHRSPSRASLKSTSKAIPAHLLTSS